MAPRTASLAVTTWLLAAAIGAAGACGRSQGVPDDKLGGLVVEPKQPDAPIDVDRAAKDPGELGRAIGRRHAAVIAALGPHTTKIATTNAVTERGASAEASALTDQAVIELGADGAYHATYTNSADYGRETIFTGGKLYLRPRYQRWHQRAPEATTEVGDEPTALREQYYGAIAATWDLVAPGAELTDRGTVQIAGRGGRKIEVRLNPSPAKLPEEQLAQRKWRATRSIEALAGEIVLDADQGVPLSVKLAATIGFSRDGRRFSMKLGVDAAIASIGAVAITAPAAGDVVATPERLREVDDRDFLLQGIAPPLRRNPDGTAVPPQPATPSQDPAGVPPAAKPPAARPPAAKPPAGNLPEGQR